jgi:hypothetical protein
VAEALKTARPAEARGPTRRIPFGNRFAAAYALLIVAFGGGLIALAVLASTNSKSEPAWSGWKPTKTGFAAAGQIATHVAAEYRTSGEGQQVVTAQAYPPVDNQAPLAGIAVRNTTDTGLSTGSFTPRNADRTLVFVLCGVLASRCMLPAQARANDVVLRREAVELTLYALKYLKGVEAVVTFLPPPDSKTNWAIYLRRDDLRDALRQPLAKTLPLATTPPIDAQDPGEGTLIERLTRPHWFTTNLQRGPTGRSILVLEDPVRPGDSGQ